MPDEVDPKTGKKVSEGRRRLEALESENQQLKARLEALEAKAKEAAEAEEAAEPGDPDEW